MNRIIKNEVKKLCDSFDKTNNYYEKGYILTFIDYLNSIMPDDKDISKMKEEIHAKVNLISNDFLMFLLSRKNVINNFVNSNSNIFSELIPSTPKTIEKDFNEMNTLSKEDISLIIGYFLGNLDERLFQFYNKMCEEGRIISSNTNNIALTSLYNSNTIIFIKNLETIEDIMVLMHELAHAYYIFINHYKIIDRSSIDFEIKDEIPAKVMEMKFIKFLEENKVYEASSILNSFFLNMMSECDNKRDNYENLKYLIASDIALKLRDNRLDITKLYKYLYKNNIYDIYNEFTNEKGFKKVLKK